MRFLLFITLLFFIFGCAEKTNSPKRKNKTTPTKIVKSTLKLPPDGVYGLNSELLFQLDTNIDIHPSCYVEFNGQKAQLLNFKDNIKMFSYSINTTNLIFDLEINHILQCPENKVLINLVFKDNNISIDTSQPALPTMDGLKQSNLSVDSSIVSLLWQSTVNPEGFNARYRKKDSFEWQQKYISGDDLILPDLNPDLDYEIEVALVDGIVGPYSEPILFSTKFNPRSLGAIIWYEAKDINNSKIEPEDNFIIEKLIDKSSYKNNAISIGDNLAKIKTYQDKKVISFDRSAYRTEKSLGEIPNNELEVYIISRTRNISNSFAFVNENQNNNQRYGSHFPWGNGQAYVDLTMRDRFNGNWGGNTLDFFAWTFRTSTNFNGVLERNGLEILTGSLKSNTPPLKKWTFGSRYDGTGEYWQADIQSIFVFNKALTNSQRDKLFEFIENNYGINMY